MSISHFEQEAAHQQFSISEQDEFTAAKLFDGTFSTAVTDVLKGMNRQAQSNFELRPDGTILLGTVPIDQNSVSGAIGGAAQGMGSALKNAIRPLKQPYEDRNAMDKPCPPNDGIKDRPGTINERPKFFDIKLESPAEAPAPRPKFEGVSSEIGAAIAEGAAAGAIGSVIRDGAAQPGPISGSLLQNLLQQNSSGGIISGLKEVLPRQNK